MLDQKVASLLNEQVNKEFYSAYLYLDFSNFYKSRSLDGYANWYEIQAREEMDHAMMMIRYLQDNDHEVVLGAIDKPQCTLESPEDPLHAGLEHERYVTKLIHTIYDAADVSETSGRCASWTGSSKNREKKRRTLQIWSAAMRCLVMIRKDCMRWTANISPGPMFPLRRNNR